jgi:hypothetical protein
MPTNKKCEWEYTKRSQARSDNDFGDMLAELRAADLTAATADTEASTNSTRPAKALTLVVALLLVVKLWSGAEVDDLRHFGTLKQDNDDNAVCSAADLCFPDKMPNGHHHHHHHNRHHHFVSVTIISIVVILITVS